MSIHVGIDPGLSGALAALRGNEAVGWLHTPVYQPGRGRRCDGAAVANFLRELSDFYGRIDRVYIELVASMPGQGVASTFAFGHAAGMVEGVVAAMKLPFTLIQPGVWKRRAGLVGKPKDAARGRALQLWPMIDDLHKKAKGQALADALLIARYGDEQ